MLHSDNLYDFRNQLKLRNISHEVMIEDVEDEIKKLTDISLKGANIYSHSTKDVHKFDFGRFHPFQDILNYVEALAKEFPDRVQVTSIGKSHENRDIPVIKISTLAKPQTLKKPAIWIDGGIHAREWISPAVVLFMIDQLIGEYKKDPFITKLVDNLDWYISPMLNPDGYEFSRSSTDPKVRFWRKNMSPAICANTELGSNICCRGVDLNRNFDWHFGEEGSSNDSCQDIYHGRAPFSEPETGALRDFILNVKDDLKSFLTFHSYSQTVMFPFGHKARSYPEDVRDLKSTALQAAKALKSVYGTNYVVGTAADIMYPASGGSDDWAKGKMGIKYTYLFELRPEESNMNGFLFDPGQIIPTALETWEAVKLIAEHVLDMFGNMVTDMAENQGPDVVGALDKIIDSEKESLTNPEAQIEKANEKTAAEKELLEYPDYENLGDPFSIPEPDLSKAQSLLVPEVLGGEPYVADCQKLIKMCQATEKGEMCQMVSTPCHMFLRTIFF
ncbi:hypothetical protein L596_029580 [Steinernema carpocapsae]|uniref:Peptidase M14 domain-containing protein n=1 Tax=Steinernema carpocapsae TaxID=34508 RepID=A0A4U5LV14_STECR|nr:hypothetical protein L596_029580 [Steinernema carpocapsae]